MKPLSVRLSKATPGPGIALPERSPHLGKSDCRWPAGRQEPIEVQREGKEGRGQKPSSLATALARFSNWFIGHQWQEGPAMNSQCLCRLLWGYVLLSSLKAETPSHDQTLIVRHSRPQAGNLGMCGLRYVISGTWLSRHATLQTEACKPRITLAHLR